MVNFAREEAHQMGFHFQKIQTHPSSAKDEHNSFLLAKEKERDLLSLLIRDNKVNKILFAPVLLLLSLTDGNKECVFFSLKKNVSEEKRKESFFAYSYQRSSQ